MSKDEINISEKEETYEGGKEKIKRHEERLKHIKEERRGSTLSDLKEEKLDLNAKTCPTREERIGSITAYYGKLSSLLKESEAGPIEQRDRTFEQTSGCVFMAASFRALSIRDAATVYHAPAGCSVFSTGYREIFRQIPIQWRGTPINPRWISTNLGENDIVYGGADKLKSAIREINKRANPRSIFILTSCTSGIMGDDIEGIVSEIQPEIKAKIVPIHCEGFRSQLMQTAYDAIWHAVLKYLVKKPEKKQEDLVNVVGVSIQNTWLDRQEINRLFGKLGLRANFVPEYAITEQFETLSEAAVSAAFCPSLTDYLLKGLKQEYGIPYVRTPIPLGIKNTGNWLRKIAEYTGKEHIVENVIKEEEARILPQLNALREEFKKIKGNGQRPTILEFSGQARTLGGLSLSNEFGLEIIGAEVLEYDRLLYDDLKELYEQIGDFDIHVANLQSYEYSNVLERTKPDLYPTCPFIGSVYKRDTPSVRHHSFRADITPYGPQIGYTGAIAYGNVLLRALKNKSLCKTLSKHTEKPYQDWWYKNENPILYAKEAVK